MNLPNSLAIAAPVTGIMLDRTELTAWIDLQRPIAPQTDCDPTANHPLIQEA